MASTHSTPSVFVLISSAVFQIDGSARVQCLCRRVAWHRSGSASGGVVDSAEVPCLPQPARDELVERVFERAASVLVDYPPLGHRVGTLRAAFARRVDVNTAQQLGFLFVEDGVVERQVGRDLGLMTGRIHARPRG